MTTSIKPTISAPSDKQRSRAAAILLDPEVAAEFGATTALDLADLHARLASQQGRLQLAGGSYPDAPKRLRKLIPMLRSLIAKQAAAA